MHATPNNPFKVTMLKPDDFIDFKQVADLYINTTKLNISKCSSRIKIEKNVVKTRTTFNELKTWNTCKVLKKGITTQKMNDSIYQDYRVIADHLPKRRTSNKCYCI